MLCAWEYILYIREYKLPVSRSIIIVKCLEEGTHQCRGTAVTKYDSGKF